MEGKFQHGESTGVKANPDDVSKEMRCLRDEKGKRIFTVEEFLRPQQISLFFSRMACKRKDGTDSDDEAEEFARQQAAVHSDVIEALQQEIIHPLSFSRKNLYLMTASEIKSLKMTQMRSMASHFSIKVKGQKKEQYSDAIIEFLNKCSCKDHGCSARLILRMRGSIQPYSLPKKEIALLFTSPVILQYFLPPKRYNPMACNKNRFCSLTIQGGMFTYNRKVFCARGFIMR